MSAPPENHHETALDDGVRDETVRDEPVCDEDLILYYYGEKRRPQEFRQRLDASPELQARYDELCRVLEAVDTFPVPEPELHYGQRVWNRLQADLEADRQQAWWKRLGKSLTAALSPPRLRTAVALTAMLAVAFVAGRYGHLVQAPEESSVLSAEGRQRIVTNVVAEHLERSQRLLIELSNAPGTTVDVGLERESAETLLSANRLYRQTTRQAGQADLTAVLDELERLLLDVAHGPDEISAVDLEDFRTRIDDVLFKVQVLGWRLRQQEQTPQSQQPPLETQSSGDDEA